MPVQVVSSSVTFLGFAVLLASYALPVTRYKILCNVFRWFNVSSSEVFPYQRTTYFRDGLDLVCRTMRSTVYYRSSAAEFLERLRLLNVDGGTFEVEFAFGV